MRLAALTALAMLPFCSLAQSSSALDVINNSKPALVRLVESGWTPNAALDLKIKALGRVRGHSRALRAFDVYFTSGTWQGAPIRIHGLYSYLAKVGSTVKLPGLLQIHGGGGHADLGQVAEAAAKGFATFAIDLPGKGWHRPESKSTGPDMTVESLFSAPDDLADNYLYQAVVSATRAITFLSSRPEVDTDRVGIFGASWGGVIGMTTTAVDPRVKCLVNVCAAGHIPTISCWGGFLAQIPKPQVDHWFDDFDPSRYVGRIKVPMLSLGSTNDTCFPLPIFEKTIREISPLPDVAYAPNLNHRLDHLTRNEAFRWMRNQLIEPDETHSTILKSLGTNPIKVALESNAVAISVGCPLVKGATVDIVYASADGESYTDRKWRSSPCRWNPATEQWETEVPNEGLSVMNYYVRYVYEDAAACTMMRACVVTRGETTPICYDLPYMHVDPQFVTPYVQVAERKGITQRDDAFWNGLESFENGGTFSIEKH